MKKVVAALLLGCAVAAVASPPTRPRACRAALPRRRASPPSAILAFVEAADQKAVGAAQLHAGAPRPRRGRGLVGALRARRPAHAVLAEQELHLDRRRAGGRRGKLSLDDTVLSFFPEDAPAEPSDNLKAMRVRDLLPMSTGHHADDLAKFSFDESTVPLDRAFLALPVAHKPGTHFLYNTPATYMLSAIVQKATGQTLLDYLGPRLFEPLGIENPTWDASPQGISLGGYGLNVTTEDIARFGQLYLQQGMWQGQQLLPADVGRRGHLAPDLERQQPEERLGPGLRLPVLALPPRRLPRRRRVRPVLHRDARAGRGDGDHQRRAGHAGGDEPVWDNLLPAMGQTALPADDADARAPEAEAREPVASRLRPDVPARRSPARCRASSTCSRKNDDGLEAVGSRSAPARRSWCAAAARSAASERVRRVAARRKPASTPMGGVRSSTRPP